MVSQRQREARKKFKQENPGLFPKPEPTPPKDPTKIKKKKPNFKHKKSDSKTLDKSRKNSSFSKKPLRVPGLKPGDCCFICKDVHHIAKNCPEKAQWEKNKICLYCRQRGHSLKNCLNKSEEVAEEKLCYNCGETGHSLSRCPRQLQDGGTKFALCFICKERGHLSKNCPKNTHGIYPKGGCCKICSGVTHLARDCPNKGNRFGAAANGGGYGINEQPRRSQVTKLISGDDLDDDFMIEEDNKVKNDSEKSTGDPAKVKKKEGPKVVNFVG
ncbi:uncharacterized protein LOC104888556 isoform X1 [Beta vulgaris subsp. vulgaris]|uniref:uncharacterized protein LOC104888556 isoform X1 n=1 Tax=Beta vulgaris subsp. vulgaris TaxID=3555 RepID=UPI0020374180|nr:uncharacterized protein LOC104888556 isoform X1 [Beta vulgaris subsp. vulgaris]